MDVDVYARAAIGVQGSKERRQAEGHLELPLGTNGPGQKSFEDGHLEIYGSSKVSKMVDEEGDKGKWHLKFASRDCYSNTALPDNWRHPRTTTMLSWRDGDLDMVFVTIPKGVMSDVTLKALNEELDGVAMVYCRERISHMWDGQTCVSFGQFKWKSHEIIHTFTKVKNRHTT